MTSYVPGSGNYRVASDLGFYFSTVPMVADGSFTVGFLPAKGGPLKRMEQQLTTKLKMKTHPVADLFPMLSKDDLKALAANIKENGLRNPLSTWEDHSRETLLLDGRNRLAACEIADVEAEFVPYIGDKPEEFVLSQNMHRRHLSESQRAMVAFRFSQICEMTQTQAATALSVSPRSVWSAGRVVNFGAPELVEHVDSGDVPVSKAALLIQKPPEVQSQHVAGAALPRREIFDAVEVTARNFDASTHKPTAICLVNDGRLVVCKKANIAGFATECADKGLGPVYVVTDGVWRPWETV